MMKIETYQRENIFIELNIGDVFVWNEESIFLKIDPIIPSDAALYPLNAIELKGGKAAHFDNNTQIRKCNAKLIVEVE